MELKCKIYALADLSEEKGYHIYWIGGYVGHLTDPDVRLLYKICYCQRLLTVQIECVKT
jgi:hypothetical protein